MKIVLNGEDIDYQGDPDMPILWFVRDTQKLKGTKFGCGRALCGACTVHLDGQAIRSCITPISAAENKKITTIEGLSSNGTHPVQQAWKEHGVPQCGYCQSGQMMQAAAFLAENKNPSASELSQAMAGNICRCGTYLRIKKAVQSAAKMLAKEGR